MNSKLWVKKAFAMCLLTAIITTGSMMALAGAPVVGELTVSGVSNSSSVTVNGEAVTESRTISASSTISVPEGMTATVNFGKLGRVQFGSGTVIALNASDSAISGSLTSGSLTVLNSAKSIAVTTASGERVEANAGETVNAAGKAAQTTTPTHKKNWVPYLAVLFGAIGFVVWGATRGGDSNFGGSTTTVSPVR